MFHSMKYLHKMVDLSIHRYWKENKKEGEARRCWFSPPLSPSSLLLLFCTRVVRTIRVVQNNAPRVLAAPVRTPLLAVVPCRKSISVLCYKLVYCVSTAVYTPLCVHSSSKLAGRCSLLKATSHQWKLFIDLYWFLMIEEKYLFSSFLY